MAGKIPKVDMTQLKRLTGLFKVVGGVSGIGYLGYKCLFTVEGGHRGVVFSRIGGVKSDIYAEGTHVIIPWFEWPVIFDVRTRPIELSSFSGTRDLQHVNISLRVLFKPTLDQLPDTLRKFGTDYDRRILPSIINETLKAVVAMYNAEQLTTQREEVSLRIKRDLQERAEDFNMVIQDCSITHLEFSTAFASAVEDKQIAQQEAEQAKYIVLMAEQDKKSAIIQAEGQAQAAQLIGESIKKNPVFAELKRMEAARDVAKVLSRANNRIYLNSDSLLVNLLSDFVKDDTSQMSE